MKEEKIKTSSWFPSGKTGRMVMSLTESDLDVQSTTFLEL